MKESVAKRCRTLTDQFWIIFKYKWKTICLLFITSTTLKPKLISFHKSSFLDKSLEESSRVKMHCSAKWQCRLVNIGNLSTLEWKKHINLRPPTLMYYLSYLERRAFCLVSSFWPALQSERIIRMVLIQ